MVKESTAGALLSVSPSPSHPARLLCLACSLAPMEQRYWRAGGENDIVEEEGRGQASVKSHLSSLLESESTESPLSPNDK